MWPAVVFRGEGSTASVFSCFLYSFLSLFETRKCCQVSHFW